MRYTVGIPARNEAATIESCIKSIYAQSLPPSEVVVCINGCTDATSQVVEQLQSKFSSLRIEQSETGKAAAWNKIVETCTTDFLLFVDADVIVNTTAAEALWHTFTHSPDLVIAGGSSYRLQPEPSLFTTFSDTTYETIDTQPFLNGKLYLTELQRIKSALARCKITTIPTDILNEDQLLHAVTKQSGTVRIIADAYAIHHPITSFRDWCKFRLRISTGRKQLHDRYPELFGRKSTLWSRCRTYHHRFKIANTIAKRFGVIIFSILKEMVHVYVWYLQPYFNRNIQWLRIDSTKRTLQTNSVETT